MLPLPDNRHPTNPGPLQRPLDEHLSPLWWPKETPLHRPGARRQSSGHVPGRTDDVSVELSVCRRIRNSQGRMTFRIDFQRPGQFVLQPVREAAEVPSEPRKDDRLHDSSAFRLAFPAVRFGLRARRRKLPLSGDD